jgi:general secretion pathway protein G
VRRGALVLVALVAVLYGAYRMWETRTVREAQHASDAELRTQLATMRTAIRRFHQEQHRYPSALTELVPQYLGRIPVDPFTRSATTWRLATEDVVKPSEDFTGSTPKTESYIIDVHSGAGAPYSDY